LRKRFSVQNKSKGNYIMSTPFKALEVDPKKISNVAEIYKLFREDKKAMVIAAPLNWGKSDTIAREIIKSEIENNITRILITTIQTDSVTDDRKKIEKIVRPIAESLGKTLVIAGSYSDFKEALGLGEFGPEVMVWVTTVSTVGHTGKDSKGNLIREVLPDWIKKTGPENVVCLIDESHRATAASGEMASLNAGIGGKGSLTYKAAYNSLIESLINMNTKVTLFTATPNPEMELELSNKAMLSLPCHWPGTIELSHRQGHISDIKYFSNGSQSEGLDSFFTSARLDEYRVDYLLGNIKTQLGEMHFKTHNWETKRTWVIRLPSKGINNDESMGLIEVLWEYDFNPFIRDRNFDRDEKRFGYHDSLGAWLFSLNEILNLRDEVEQPSNERGDGPILNKFLKKEFDCYFTPVDDIYVLWNDDNNALRYIFHVDRGVMSLNLPNIAGVCNLRSGKLKKGEVCASWHQWLGRPLRFNPGVFGTIIAPDGCEETLWNPQYAIMFAKQISKTKEEFLAVIAYMKHMSGWEVHGPEVDWWRSAVESFVDCERSQTIMEENCLFNSADYDSVVNYSKVYDSSGAKQDRDFAYKDYPVTKCEYQGCTCYTDIEEQSAREGITDREVIDRRYFQATEIDHIDGNRFNNDFDNLRRLCPNRHTFKTMLSEDYLNPKQTRN
jgi:hypothetical protein